MPLLSLLGLKTTLSDLGGTKIAPESIPASFAYIFDYARSINSNPVVCSSRI